MLNWNEIIKNYIIKHSNRISKTTRPLHDHFGIAYFTYHRIDNAGKYTVLVDRPNWAEYYVGAEIFRIDPYLKHPSVYQAGMSLFDSHGSKEYKENVTKAGKEVLDVDLGAILIQKNNQCVEFFGFSANKERSSLQNLFLNHSHLLKSFAQHFKNELGSVLNQMEQEAASLLDLGTDFNNPDPIAPDISSDVRLAYYKDLGMISGAEKLSPRERECLKLLIEEKSAKETAVALGLKPRTVEFYFENIKDKLTCWSKQEVLKIARNWNELGLL